MVGYGLEGAVVDANPRSDQRSHLLPVTLGLEDVVAVEFGSRGDVVGARRLSDHLVESLGE
ncbi:hypothetical protein KCH_28120 [Kitasatospora cheerisanensis KCTC 2395]|uniref:Uncharacterized protein n=1 Tax=Kitasatospora cheerisanensis KCTC 2395 TaxID=1348663 RepID=A0A066Z4Z0_9ACTN|nr:hypothetical protein KCH_28120 [Kitasatospora cheerisanensis KCTC 2395]